MGAKESIFALLDPESKVSIKVVIPEGSRSKYVFAAAAQALGVSVGDFESLAKDPKDLGLPEYAKIMLRVFFTLQHIDLMKE